MSDRSPDEVARWSNTQDRYTKRPDPAGHRPAKAGFIGRALARGRSVSPPRGSPAALDVAERQRARNVAWSVDGISQVFRTVAPVVGEVVADSRRFLWAQALWTVGLQRIDAPTLDEPTKGPGVAPIRHHQGTYENLESEGRSSRRESA